MGRPANLSLVLGNVVPSRPPGGSS